MQGLCAWQASAAVMVSQVGVTMCLSFQDHVAPISAKLEVSRSLRCLWCFGLSGSDPTTGPTSQSRWYQFEVAEVWQQMMSYWCTMPISWLPELWDRRIHERGWDGPLRQDGFWVLKWATKWRFHFFEPKTWQRGLYLIDFFSSFSFYRLTALDSQEASTAVSVTWVTTCISFHANSFSVIKVIRTDGFSVIIHYRNLMIKDEFLWMLINNPEGQKQQCRQTEETSQQERLFVTVWLGSVLTQIEVRPVSAERSFGFFMASVAWNFLNVPDSELVIHWNLEKSMWSTWDTWAWA